MTDSWACLLPCTPLPQALDHIRQLRPSSCPNEGFVAQLGLFQDMRCSLDTEHPVYRMWCVQQVRQVSTTVLTAWQHSSGQ
jgi:hypothetical protein